MANKKLVFIHGSDPDQADTPWMFYHLNPSTYGGKPVLGEGKTFDLAYFDYEQDRLTIWENWAASRSKHAPMAAPTSSTDISLQACRGARHAGLGWPSGLGK